MAAVLCQEIGYNKNFLNPTIMFKPEYFKDFIKSEIETHKKPNLHAVHFNRLKAYRKDWNIQKILIFEYMLLCCKQYGNNFTQKTTMIMDYTRLGINSVLKYIAQLEGEGYLSVNRSKDGKGVRELNWYTVNFDTIISFLESIYLLPEKETQYHKDELIKMFTFIKENPYKN